MSNGSNRGLLFGAVIIVVAAVIAWFSGFFSPAPSPETAISSQPASQSAPQSAPVPAVSEPAAPQPAAPSAPAPQAAETATPQPAPTPATPVPAADTPQPAPETKAEAPAVVAPSFDVLRAEGDGSIVIAGKAAPAAQVEVMDGSKVLGKVEAGPTGDFAVVLDEPLKPGDYQIVLRATTPDKAAAMSQQTAIVSIPDTPSGQVLALVEEPGKPAQLITKPEVAPEQAAAATEGGAPAQPQTPAIAQAPAAAAAQADGQPAATAPQPSARQVKVEAVEIEGDKLFVAGIADPGRHVRAYANDMLLGDATASPDGRFLIETQRKLPVGDYIIRVDALGTDGSTVVARAAVPFQREAGEQISAVAPQAPATAPGAAPSSSSDTATPAASADGTTAPKLEPAKGAVIIRKGDSLWRISRRVYGQGVRYSNIYLANQDQIQDPDRIWPGQVFKVPVTAKDGAPADMDALKDQATTVE